MKHHHHQQQQQKQKQNKSQGVDLTALFIKLGPPFSFHDLFIIP